MDTKMSDRAIVKANETTALGLPLDVRELVMASKADNTKRAYKAAWQEFMGFCAERGLQALPASPETVVEYIRWAARKVRPATLAVKLAGLSFAHRAAKLPDPTIDENVKVLMAGIRRKLGTAPSKKAPATFENVRVMVDNLPGDLAGMRDKALLLVGFGGAFRRSELAGLDVEDIHFNGKEMKITVRRSKTDQEGQGKVKTIPYLAGELAGYDPAAALKTWLKAADIASGPCFRKVDKWGKIGAHRLTDQVIAVVIKEAAEAAGLEPGQFAGHSLRSGYITSAALGGAQLWQIMEQSGHKSERVAMGYIQALGLGAGNATRAAFGAPAEPSKTRGKGRGKR